MQTAQSKTRVYQSSKEQQAKPRFTSWI